MSIVKDEHLFDGGLENPGDVMGKFQGRVVFALLQIDDGLPPHPHLYGEIPLGHVGSCPEFLDTGFHISNPVILSGSPGNDAMTSIVRIYKASLKFDRTPAVRALFLDNRT